MRRLGMYFYVIVKYAWGLSARVGLAVVSLIVYYADPWALYSLVNCGWEYFGFQLAQSPLIIRSVTAPYPPLERPPAWFMDMLSAMDDRPVYHSKLALGLRSIRRGIEIFAGFDMFTAAFRAVGIDMEEPIDIKKGITTYWVTPSRPI